MASSAQTALETIHNASEETHATIRELELAEQKILSLFR